MKKIKNKLTRIITSCALVASIFSISSANLMSASAVRDFNGEDWNYCDVKKKTLTNSSFSGSSWSSPKSLWVNFEAEWDEDEHITQCTLKPYYNKNIGKDKAYSLVAAVNAGMGAHATITANGSTSYGPTKTGKASQSPTIKVSDGTSILYRGVVYWN